MCNTLSTQRRLAVERLTEKFARDINTPVRGLIPQLLGEAFDAGVLEAGVEEAPPVDDEALDELNREREAIESGCVEPPKGGWLTSIHPMSGVRCGALTVDDNGIWRKP